MSTRGGIVSPNPSMIVLLTCTSVMALENWHALSTWPCSVNATLFPCRGTTLTAGPGSNIRSHKNEVFSFPFNLDLFVLFLMLEVPIRLMFVRRLKCEELAF